VHPVAQEPARLGGAVALPAPDTRFSRDPVGSEDRPGHQAGGVEEAAVGLRQGGHWTEEEFRLVVHEMHQSHYRRLVGLATIWVDAAAEDAVQDAFVSLLSRPDRIREPDKLLAYLRWAVLHNAWSELRHRRVTRRPFPLSSAGALASDDDGCPVRSTSPTATEDEALGRLVDEAIVRGVRRLPRQQAACIALRCYLGLSEKEIAEVCKIKPGSVKKQLSRARRKLGPLVETNDD
jgi:RNA polymerase sigma factor (sigma-70 family)